MAAKLGLVLDCADPDKLAEFWSAAIGYTTLGGAGSYVLLVDETGQQPKLLLGGPISSWRNGLSLRQPPALAGGSWPRP